MGLLRADGHLRFLGRYKDMLKIGGENVDPMEVEAFLLTKPAHQHVAVVVSYPDPRLAEVAVAFVVREDGAALTEEDVFALAAAASRASRSRVASSSSTTFPMTGSGKIQKYLLREEAQRRAATLRSPSESSDAGSPGHEADRVVAGIASNRPGGRA